MIDVAELVVCAVRVGLDDTTVRPTKVVLNFSSRTRAYPCAAMSSCVPLIVIFPNRYIHLASLHHRSSFCGSAPRSVISSA